MSLSNTFTSVVSVVGLSAVLATSAYAQTPPAPAPAAPAAPPVTPPVVPPVDAGRALQETSPALPPSARPEAAPLPLAAPQPEAEPLVLPDGQTLEVKAFRFEGDLLGADAATVPHALSDAQLQAVVAPFVGRALKMADVLAATDRVTALYRAQGFMLARAYVPKQDARDGTLVMRVVAGRYGKVSLRNESRLRDGVAAGFFAGLGRGEPVTRDGLERVMLLVSDLPGATMPKVSIAPGQAQGTSDFAVLVGPGRRYGGYALADNYGSRYTGEGRVSVGASLYSPAGLGDALDFSGMSSGSGGLVNGRLGYSAPLGYYGLRGELAVSHTQYRLGDVYAPLDASGRADALEGNLSYPVVRSRSQNVVATLGLAARDLRDVVASVGQTTTRRLYSGTLGLSHERWGQAWGRDAYWSLTGGLTLGHLAVGGPEMRAANVAGAHTVGGYARANVSALGRLAVTPRLSVSASLNVQRALNRNLDSSEQFSISGIRGVMAFQEVSSGDNGYLANVELRYGLPGWAAGMEHSVSVFADSGHVGLHDAGYLGGSGTTLYDVGIGYAASYKGLFARVRLAHAIGGWPASVPTNGRNRFLAQLGAAF